MSDFEFPTLFSGQPCELVSFLLLGVITAYWGICAAVVFVSIHKTLSSVGTFKMLFRKYLFEHIPPKWPLKYTLWLEFTDFKEETAVVSR